MVFPKNIGSRVPKDSRDGWYRNQSEANLYRVNDTDILCKKDYKEFLLTSNGAILYKSEYEDDGYKLLSLEEMEKVTQEMKDDGYDISDKCYCFLQCLFSDDVLLFDLQKEADYIMEGDVGYPADEWEYIGSDINTFFIRLCQCNGAMYWRW